MLWSGAAYLAGPAAQLLAAPYIIHRLGSEVYGVLLLVNTVVQISSVSSFGLGDATVKYVAEYAAQKRSDDLLELIRTTLLLYLFLGGLTVFGINLVAPLLADSVFKVSADYRADAIFGLRIGSCSILLSLIYSVGQSLCRGLRRHDVESSTAVLGSLLGPASSCFLVSRGYGLAAVVAVTCGIMCLNNLVLAWRCTRLLGTSAWLLPKYRWDNIRRLASYGVFGWIQMLEWVLVNQADRLVISSVLGPAAVTAYAICLQLTQMASGIVAQAFSYVFPLATELYAKKRLAELNWLFLSGMQLTSIASLSIGALLFVYGQTILFVWLGNGLGHYDHNLILILASSAALMGTTIVPFYVLNGAGYVRLNAVFTMSSTAAIFPCSLLFVHWFGVVGMAASKLMTVFPGLVARAITGRLILKDSRIWIGLWQLLPTMGGLALLWLAELKFSLPGQILQHPYAALGTVLGAIATTTGLSFLVYQPALKRLVPKVSEERTAIIIPTN